MGIKSEISADVAAAFDTDLADAVKQFNYKVIEQLDYDPDIGVPTRLTVEHLSRGVFGGFAKDELADQTILPTDIKVTVLQVELPLDQTELRIIPKTDDEVIELDAAGNPVKTYKVVGFTKDPAETTYGLQVRSTANADQ